MSFDLGVWHEPKPITPASAQAKYERLLDGEFHPPGHPAVTRFVERLTDRYPQIDDVDEDALDHCPWTQGFDESAGHCLLGIRWSAVDRILPQVVAIAKECGLLCYDPQNQRILTE